MDRFLESLYEYYDGTLSVTTPLAKSIMEQDYFQQFSDIRDYIERNLMWDYLQYDEDQDGTPISVLRLLSAAETFEDYVRMVTAIVQHRGGQMLALLRSTVTNDIASV